jgi:hypothetical protein
VGDWLTNSSELHDRWRVEVFVIVWTLSDETANKRFDPNPDWYSPLAFDLVDHAVHLNHRDDLT